MSDLAEFLLARIAEDEAVAHEMKDNEAYWSDCGEPHNARIEILVEGGCWVLDARRLLAECEAKRRIVSLAQRASLDAASGAVQSAEEYARSEAMQDALESLALPYADHPDYREEWRP